MRFKRTTIPGKFKRKTIPGGFKRKATLKIVPGRGGWDDRTKSFIERIVENINGGGEPLYGKSLKTITEIINRNYPNGKRTTGGLCEHSRTVTETINRNYPNGKKRIKRMGRG